MPAAVEAALRSAIGVIPGVAIAGISHRHKTGANEMSLAEVEIAVHGWSPSLNAIAMVWKATNRVRLGPDGQIDILRNQLADVIAAQTRRAAEGVSIGTATPFEALSADELPVGHVLMDRGLADLVTLSGRDGAPDLRRHVGHALHVLHRESHDGRSNTIANDDWIEGRVFTQMMPIGDDVTYWGDRLWVRPERIPETLRIAAVGRRLGEVAAVPACIADHVVTGIEPADDEGSDVHVTPVLMTIDAIERARTEERIERMRDSRGKAV